MKRNWRGPSATRGAIGFLGCASLILTLPASAQTAPGTYVYPFDDGPQQQHAGLNALWQKGAEAGCARRTGPQVAPFLVPLILFGVNAIFRVIEADLSRREERELASMSATWSGVFTSDAFPQLASGAGLKCIVVHRVDEEPGQGSAYVLGLKRVGASGFTVQGVAGWLGSSDTLLRSGDKLNTTISFAAQYVATRDGANQLVSLPAHSIEFEDLTANGEPVAAANRASPVLPVPEASASPTSFVVAVTEANTRLASRKQQIALEQAHRAALVEAIGEVIKGALGE